MRAIALFRAPDDHGWCPPAAHRVREALARGGSASADGATRFGPCPGAAATEDQRRSWAKADRGMLRGVVHDENAWALGGVAGHALARSRASPGLRPTGAISRHIGYDRPAAWFHSCTPEDLVALTDKLAQCECPPAAGPALPPRPARCGESAGGRRLPVRARLRRLRSGA